MVVVQIASEKLFPSATFVQLEMSVYVSHALRRWVDQWLNQIRSRKLCLCSKLQDKKLRRVQAQPHLHPLKRRRPPISSSGHKRVLRETLKKRCLLNLQRSVAKLRVLCEKYRYIQHPCKLLQGPLPQLFKLLTTNRPNPQRSSPSLIDPINAFYIFAIANVVAALYAPLSDCDEVFNYWEPTHYLNRGYGLQTWEYSPEFSIRSWVYIVLHAIPGKLGSLFSAKKSFEFYFLRTILGLVCALCESRLFSTISKALNPRVGIIFMIVMLFSPGMFHASIAYLPSSFSMYMTMLGMTSFMDWRGGSETHVGIMWFGIGAIIGWPFAGALIAPFIAEELILVSITKDFEVARRFIDGTVRCLIVLVCCGSNPPIVPFH